MLDEILSEISRIYREKHRVTVAIDGRCASGKTTLANDIKSRLDCNVFHMDDFFLRPEQRTPERYAQAGGNVDRERFLCEVLLPALQGETIHYRAFDCHTMTMGAPLIITPKDIVIVEGTYCCHPELWSKYDLHIFLTTSPEEQMSRIELRNRASADIFKKRWIPLEERYFKEFDIEKRCDLKFTT